MNADLQQSKSTWKFILGIVLSAISGVMLLLAFPPYGIWPLAWIALVPSRFATHKLLPLKWSSLGESIAALFWLGPFMARLFGTQFGPFFTYLGVLIAILVFFLAKGRKFHELTAYRWYVLEGMLGWVGFEMIRASFIPLVATSAFIGYTQASQSWLIQPVSVFSTYGLNLVIILVNYALALFCMALFDKKWQAVDTVKVDHILVRRWLMIAGFVLVAWIGISLVILNGNSKGMPTVKVAAIQPNYALPAFQDKTQTAEQRVNDFAQQVRSLSQQGAKIIFTPEMMFNFNPQVEFTEQLQKLASETGTYLFLDYTIVVEDQPWHNEAVLLSPDGKFSEVYAKNHNPPGEPLSPNAGSYPVFVTPLGRLAAMICHDANYTDVARKLAQNGAQLISTGLSEFGGFGEQFWTNTTFRAVENRTAIVVAARQSGSVIIDPTGRQVALNIRPGQKLTLLNNVTLGALNAPYTFLGDILGWVSLGGFAFFTVYSSIIEKKFKKKGEK